MERFLTAGTPESNSFPDWPKLLQTGQPLEPHTLYDYLVRCRETLLTESSYNFLSNSSKDHWLDWWIDHLKDFTYKNGYHPYNNLVPFENLKNINKGKYTGIRFMPHCKGCPETRQIVDQMLKWYDIPIIFLSPDSEIRTKEDITLPLAIRVSLWSYYDRRLTVSVEPSKPAEIHPEIHRQKIAKDIGAYIHPV